MSESTRKGKKTSSNIIFRDNMNNLKNIQEKEGYGIMDSQYKRIKKNPLDGAWNLAIGICKSKYSDNAVSFMDRESCLDGVDKSREFLRQELQKKKESRKTH